MNTCPHCSEPPKVEGASDGCSTACYPVSEPSAINITNPVPLDVPPHVLDAMRREWQRIIGEQESTA